MTSIAKTVWKLIEDDVIARRALDKGFASMKNLSMYFIKKHKLSTTSDAVISAIRRYKEEQPLEKKYETAKKIIAISKGIRITSNIVNITLRKNRKTQELVQKTFNMVDYDRGELLLIMQGEQSIKLLINDKNREKILNLFPKDSVSYVQNNLAEINIHLSDEARKTPGIISVLSTELMLHDINMVETMSCLPELLFFVDEKDVVKSYDVLFNLCNPK
ncbi:hypothetical protein HQ529_01760 [Candidatus Woesearchaeota archaeon]|nr:hypothetical protein [Candidatus Woesearchaeota archaeon]